MLNPTKKNINLISFTISMFLFFLIVLFFKYISNLPINSSDSSSLITQNSALFYYNQSQSDIPIPNQADLSLEQISLWTISIDKLNLSTTISEGTSDNILLSSVGHLETSNYLYGTIILKAYNTGTTANYFANLKDLIIDDEIIYTVNEFTQTYKVTSNIIINESDITSVYTTNSLILLTYVKDMPRQITMCNFY